MYRRTNLPKYLYRTLTNKSRIIQKKIVSFVDDDETVLNFVNSKRNGEVVEIVKSCGYDRFRNRKS